MGRAVRKCVRPVHVLVLDGQLNSALACVRSLGRAGHTTSVASTFVRPLASWSRFCRGAYRYHTHSLRAFAGVRAWACLAGVNVVLPLSELTCGLCNAEREAWESLGIVVGCPPPDLLDLAFDKAATLRLAQACGLRTPITHVPATLEECHEAARAIGYPCIVKPRLNYRWDGDRVRAKGDVAFVTNAADLQNAVLDRRQGEQWPLIQSVATGVGKGVFALYNRGAPLAWFAHEALRRVRPLASPSCVRRSVALDPRLQEPAQALLGRMAWHGPAMVEFLDDGASQPCLMEVNGRFWNSLSLTVAAGADFPVTWLRVLAGERVSPGRGYREGVVMRWLWGDVKRTLGALLEPRSSAANDRSMGRGQAIRDLFRHPAGAGWDGWQGDDPWPAVGEWVEAARDVRAWFRRSAARS